ncbi:MAG TPA: CDP-alcohol phosphatidyltransferase family protein [Gemmatimonadaceae bacterium]
MNLPNALSLGRIVAAPFIALLPFGASWELRLAGFVLYIAAAITDYYDGVLARTRNLVTDVGKLLDPLADKLLLFATFIPMYLLQTSSTDRLLGFIPATSLPGAAFDFAFVTPFGRVGLPFWVVAVIVGRELFMTIFRQAAARRGVVIAAIGPAKWKLGFQSTWVGAAYFWFAAASAARSYGWTGLAWRAFANFNGLVGVVTMSVAVVLTLYSFGLYLRRYSSVFVTSRG